jgi:hypothetical protein
MLVCLAGLGCKGVTKDECKEGPPKCDGTTRKECMGPGGRDNIFGVRYYHTTDCAQRGEQCVENGGQAECALDDVPCDPKASGPTLTPAGTGELDLVECATSIGGQMYRTRRRVTACDPATFVRTCANTSCATRCVPAVEVLQQKYPDALLTSLRGRTVEDCESCPGQMCSVINGAIDCR